MTNEKAKKMLKAKLECLKRETSGTDIDCNYRNCDECNLCYEQGNMGEQKETLEMAIKALEQQPCDDCVSREDVVRILDWSKASVQMLDDYSADELVGEIITIEKEVENLLSVKPQTVTDFADKCKECGKILNETYQQKWIPVSEKLPKSLEDVLATDGVDMFVAFVREKTKGKYEWYSLDANYDKNTPIEAWMPLPQPYKVESEGKDETDN